MATKNETDNIVLSIAQQNQANLLERRLINFQNEITVAKEELDGLKAEIKKADAENEYLRETYNTIEAETEKLKGVRDAIVKDRDSAQTELSEYMKASKELSDANTAKSADLNKRDIALKQTEDELSKKVEDFNIKHSQLLEDQLSTKTAKDAFLKATETVTW